MESTLIRIGILFFICLHTLSIYGQKNQNDIFNKIEGHWQGAFIKNNSFQKLDVQFYKQQEQISSLQIIEEWHPQFGEFVLPVKIDSLGQITFNTGHGKAIMQLDNNSLEMVGKLEGSLPTIYVHLKKIPNPPTPQFNVQEINIKNDSISLFGHLHEPNSQSKTAIIIVGGRSCFAGSTKYDLYAKLLRNYGVSVLVFNKRGTGKSTGDCSKATITDLASDVVACKNYLAKHPNQYSNIGVLGSSAGGWVMMKAEEKTNFDFMISVVGPATSVKEQQLQSMDYGFDFYKLSRQAKSDLLEYTNMMFKAEATPTNFTRFEELLKSSKENGWFQLLDDTDIPKSIEEINNLWVRRHNYDPRKTLSTFDKPFLGIYGEIDWIAPFKENIERLNELFPPERKQLLNTIIAHDAEHGTETKGKYISLERDRSYWRFFRISPIVQIAIIDFLRKYELI
ncbi:MAG: prolyl oligopeptidase family serine peptidase [Maribacter sp.]|nr:alpha/beta hydrolase [Croceitalea sp.]NNK76301.1 prolyl oligopeptidase family serine peptidase [Maribacter sp.]